MKRSLLELINEVLIENPIPTIHPDMHLRNDIGMDSLDLAHLTVLIEDEYGVDIFEENNVNTILDVLNKING
jgi:acyl carrier protein